MLFPSISEIINPTVVTLSHRESIATALRTMHANDIRDVVVTTGNPGEYGVLTVNDLIRFGTRDNWGSISISETGYKPLHVVDEEENLLEVFTALSPSDEYIGVINKQHELKGLVSNTDIISSIDPQLIIEHQRIGDLFDKMLVKRADTETALNQVLFALSNINDAVVIVDSDKPVGIITTKDAIRLINNGVDTNVPVSHYMTSPVETFSHKLTIKEALYLLKQKQYKRLVVADERQKLIGVINQKELVSLAYSRWSDLLRSQADELHQIIELLEKRTQRLEYLASTDALTGVYNRSKFEQVLEAEIVRYSRYKSSPFALVMLDVDHFKAFNDQYGHLNGDKVLKAISETIMAHIRESDTFARWGGEEFVLLMPHTDTTHAMLLTQRLCDTVRELSINGLPTVTISAGVAQYQENDALMQLVERADQALYASKKAGRDRVTIGA